MEVLPIVHELSGERTGECLPRHELLARAEWCQTTNVFVMDSEGRVLCHQRSLQKERLPGVWMTHLGGHVSADETYLENAQKELHEEAGITCETSELINWRTTKIPSARVWVGEYVVLKDIPLETLVPQPGEVEKFAWMTIDEILKDEAEHPENWCAGTHDFFVEYHCLRASLTTAKALGAINPPQPIHAWHPISLGA